MNKKIIYLSVFLVFALFLINSCQQYNKVKGFDVSSGGNGGESSGEGSMIQGSVAEVPIGSNIYGPGLLDKDIKLYDDTAFLGDKKIPASGWLTFDKNINTQSSLAGPFRDINYQDRIVMTAVPDSIKFTYIFNEGINLNSVRSFNPLKINFLDNTLSIVRINSATSFTLDNGLTYYDGDAYISEDKENPRWVWAIVGLDSAYGTGAQIGIELDHNFRDGGNEPAIENNLGKDPTKPNCIDLPNNYVSVCLEGSTIISYDDVRFELQEGVDLSSDSGVPGLSSASTVVIQSNPVNNNIPSIKLSNGKLTDKMWVTFNSTGNLLTFYKDKENSNKITYYYDVNPWIRGNYLKIGFDEKSLILTMHDLTVENENYDLSLYFYRLDGVINSLGKTKSLEEPDELQYCNSDGHNDCINIGIIDKNLRTAYGMIIRDAQVNGAYDRVALSVPDKQIKAKVSVAKKTGKEFPIEEKVLLETSQGVDLTSDSKYLGLYAADTAHIRSSYSTPDINLRKIDFSNLTNDKNSREVWLAAKPGQSCNVLVFYQDPQLFNKKTYAGEIILKNR